LCLNHKENEALRICQGESIEIQPPAPASEFVLTGKVSTGLASEFVFGFAFTNFAQDLAVMVPTSLPDLSKPFGASIPHKGNQKQENMSEKNLDNI
jgi:hypothetical protein